MRTRVCMWVICFVHKKNILFLLWFYTHFVLFSLTLTLTLSLSICVFVWLGCIAMLGYIARTFAFNRVFFFACMDKKGERKNCFFFPAYCYCCLKQNHHIDNHKSHNNLSFIFATLFFFSRREEQRKHCLIFRKQKKY